MKTIISLLTIFGILVLCTIMLYIIHKRAEYILYCSIFQIFFTVILYYFLCLKGHIYWYILPLGWILCIGFSLFYVYVIAKQGVFFGKDFELIGILFINNIPVIIVSSILALVYRFILMK